MPLHSKGCMALSSRKHVNITGYAIPKKNSSKRTISLSGTEPVGFEGKKTRLKSFLQFYLMKIWSENCCGIPISSENFKQDA